MKKLVVLLVCIVCSVITSFGQISIVKPTEKVLIGKVGGGGLMPFIASLSYSKGDGENYYTLSYNNCKYKTITSINDVDFKGNDEMINNFYLVLNELFDSEVGTKKEFNIGSELMSVECISNLGVKSLQIFTSHEGTVGYFWITRKQLNKLFGK